MSVATTLGTAIALLEYGSIAAGIEGGDAMVKRAAVEVIRAGTVHPGRYLVLLGGEVAELEEAVDAAERIDDGTILDRMFLPDPHPDLVVALTGPGTHGDGESVGIVETSSAAAIVRAADAGLKGAAVALRSLFLADDLGGKGYLLFVGPLYEVEAAVDLAVKRAGPELVSSRIIAQLHDEMGRNLTDDGRFGPRMRGG